jgi:hypothetical protein
MSREKVQLGARIARPLERELKKAAEDEKLLLSGLVEKILTEWLKARYPELAKEPEA